MSGCAQRADVTAFAEPYGSYAGSISAREYGFVKPARDVSVNGARRLAQNGSSGDLWSRVRAGMQLDLHANTRIDSTLERFRRDPRYLEKLSQRASPYLPYIAREIERRGFPMELAFLPHVESRYNPSATSPKAAAGMWQFMPYTAREMGLRLDGGRDERRDPIASTRAALDYLQQLNRRFDGDWELAMAAYNCGPGRVESAIASNRRSGRATDFWSLDLPSETRQYVPQILAAARLVAESRRISANSSKIDVIPAASASTSSRVAVRLHQRQPGLLEDASLDSQDHLVRNGETLASVALRHGLDLETLAEWNGMSVRDPLLPGQTLSIPTKRHSPQVVTHRVRKGDSISAIARRYGVTTADIQRWNRITDARIAPGDTLRIYRRSTKGSS
ncbi:transglycosylase SLT domain-containing protein [Imhoffiella purpurea]|uniref:Membrane-bound lytic murein transglycosylase D n=1 Tax=Imhoffiella purpurea TaxID=1249627 RepID=W9V9X0_9GAMM|nr:transglycosylase SLT domain-containing protein [Imhoffiella purpurea]EXJ16254.1 Membrane-bound lytic murein transglycosylase D precursor [Imhoffiella purpurea]